MDIALNWNEWHQETVRKPYARVGVTLLSGALIPDVCTGNCFIILGKESDF